VIAWTLQTAGFPSGAFVLVQCYLIAMDENLIESLRRHEELFDMSHKAGHRLREAAARSCSCAANSFVCLCVITVFVCYRAPFCREITPERHKTVSTERAQHTEIPLPRDKEPLRSGSTRAKFARGSVRSAARGNMVSTLRGKATNIASRGSRAQSIPGLRSTAAVLIRRNYGG
jgi:hypothetical protein